MIPDTTKTILLKGVDFFQCLEMGKDIGNTYTEREIIRWINELIWVN